MATDAEFIDDLMEFLNTKRPREVEYYLKKLKMESEYLYNNLPIKKGDRVKLKITPEISKDKAWGWMGAKHFLIKGAKAKVHSIDLNTHSGKIQVGLKFDKDSWIDSEGNVNKRKKEERGIYSFNIDNVKKLKCCKEK